MKKEAVVRYYFDADILGLAKVVSKLRPDVTFPGDPGGTVHKRQRGPCPITGTETKDRVWIPIVASEGWIIITRDKRIRDRPAERQAVLDYGAKIFTIVGTGNLDKWAQLEILMPRWRDIEKYGSEKGPFIYDVYRTTTSRVL